MSPEELDSLANDIEDSLKRDLVLVKGFHSESLQDDRRAKKVLAVKILCLLNMVRLFILSFSCLFPSSKTSTNLKIIFVDTFFPFGSFSCLTNQILLIGLIYLQNFLHVMHEAEKNDQLLVISEMKNHRQFMLTPLERSKFATFLKWMKMMRSLFIYVTVPSLLLFLGMAACLSLLEVQSMTFTAASIFVTIINCTQIYFGCVWGHYSCMVPVHSNNVLSIQFNRVFERIKNLQRSCNFIPENLKLDWETREKELPVKVHQWGKRAQQRVKEHLSILTVIENVLRQMDLHNDLHLCMSLWPLGWTLIVGSWGNFVVLFNSFPLIPTLPK